ncbi:surface anchored protein [Streptococcus pneumoniae]|uniref:DUF1542 domain-containing protein n=1 Tax=Streptococcus pneumoniae TaxID=1313 RepID=UPI0005E2842D|nr:DUF1542 domain-containing protein [Streptococcus pneumoniae]COF72096.1 surface anchored protein [Streptococcus pneumoniae]
MITTLAHDVTVNEITKPTKGNPTSQDLLDAVEATNKKSVALKQGENYPETFGTHQIHLIVTYQDDSTEEKVANYTVPDTRDAAKDDIDTKATAKKNDIEADDQLTTEEKQAAKDKVDAAAQSAKDAVTAATTNDGVTQAQNDGTTAVNNVDTTPQAKPSAKAEIDAKVQDANNAIDQNQDLTDDERREAKKAVKDAADEAKANIDKATSAGELTTAKNNGLDKLNEPHNASVKQKAKDDIDTKATAKKNDIEAAQSGTNPVTPPSTTRSRRTPPRRSRRSVGFVGNSQTGTTPSAVDKSELQSLVEDLERRLQDLADLSPEALEEAQSILREAQVALANDSLTAQELAEFLAKVRQALNSIQAGTSADKSPSTSNSNKEAESAKEPTNATDVPLYGVFGAAALSLLGALLFAVARKKNSQLDKLSRELNQLVVELEASDKDKKDLGKAKKLAKKARIFVDSQQKDPQKEAELISEIKTILSQLK